ELNVPPRRPLLADAAPVAPRSAAGEIAALDDHHVAHPAHRQVVRDRKPDHTAADDGHVAAVFHFSSSRTKFCMAVATMEGRDVNGGTSSPVFAARIRATAHTHSLP